MRSFTFGRAAAAHSFVLTGLLALCGTSSAATVVLRDGTVIQGEVKSLQDGIYTVETDSVGTLRVPKQEVRSISEGGQAATGSAAGSSTGEALPGPQASDAVKSRITQDPELLATVLALQNDPDVLAVLADPAITKAIAAGDYAALMSNPKIVALMQNAKVRQILDATR